MHLKVIPCLLMQIIVASRFFIHINTPSEILPQPYRTGRPEARARGNRCDVTLTDAGLPVQTAPSSAPLRPLGLQAIAPSEGGPPAALGQKARRKRLLAFLYVGDGRFPLRHRLRRKTRGSHFSYFPGG